VAPILFPMALNGNGFVLFALAQASLAVTATLSKVQSKAKRCQNGSHEQDVNNSRASSTGLQICFVALYLNLREANTTRRKRRIRGAFDFMIGSGDIARKYSQYSR